MPIAYGMVGGVKHPDNAPAAPTDENPPKDKGPVAQPVEIAPVSTACPSCGVLTAHGKIKDGMCGECRYEAGLPIHARNMRRAWRRDGRRMKDVAVKLHIKPSALSNYMTGRVSPTLAVFSAICRELGVTPNEVLEFESKEKK